MKRKLAGWAVVVLVLAACGEGGQIVKKECTIKAAPVCGKYWLTVQDGAGNKERFAVRRSIGKTCKVGDYYPQCKED